MDVNPILENLNPKHREIDLFKASVENLRLAAPLLNAERGDPEIDKTVLIRKTSGVLVDTNL